MRVGPLERRVLLGLDPPAAKCCTKMAPYSPLKYQAVPIERSLGRALSKHKDPWFLQCSTSRTNSSDQAIIDENKKSHSEALHRSIFKQNNLKSVSNTISGLALNHSNRPREAVRTFHNIQKIADLARLQDQCMCFNNTLCHSSVFFCLFSLYNPSQSCKRNNFYYVQIKN